jgi:hypothetical protein
MLILPAERLENKLVQALAKTPGLTALELQAAVSKGEDTYSLQALYKELGKLVDADVITKERTKYFVRLPWIVNLLAFATEIYEVYSSHLVVHSLPTELPPTKNVYIFRSLNAAESLFGHFLTAIVQSASSDTVTVFSQFPWHPLIHMEKRPKFMEALQRLKKPFLTIVGCNSFLSRLVQAEFPPFYQAQYTENFPECYKNGLFVIVEPYVVKIEFPKKISNLIENLFAQVNPSSTKITRQITEIFDSPTKIKLTVQNSHREAVKAHTIRDKITDRWWKP